MVRDISGGACFVAAAVDRSDGYCKEGRGGRYYIWQRWILQRRRRPWCCLAVAAVVICGGRKCGGRETLLGHGVLGGYHNSRYLHLFASIAWLILLGGGGGRNM